MGHDAAVARLLLVVVIGCAGLIVAFHLLGGMQASPVALPFMNPLRW